MSAGDKDIVGGASGNLTTIRSVGATWGDVSIGTGNPPSSLPDSPNCVSGCWQSRMSAGDRDVWELDHH